ncbi:ComEC/Rec2 family competence protein [bacterium]|nr:ComEC/Rec2 family competence protein [bacterium]
MLSDNNIFKDKDIELVALGRVTSSPFRKFDKTYFDFEINQLKIIQKENGSFKELNNCGNVFASYKSKDNPDLHLDDFIQANLTGMQSYVGNSGNSSYIFDTEKITACGEKGLKSYFHIFKKRFHYCLSLLFDINLNTVNSKIASALILGNQAEIPEKITASFKESGIYHLLAISGLHISITASFIYFILRKINFSIWGKKTNISYFIFLFLVLYNFIVGAKASMMRASIMFCLTLFAKDFHKDFLVSNSFFITYIMLLLICPDYLINPGFILSFTSVGAIIFVIPIVKKTINYFLNFKKLTENYMMKSIITAVSINMVISPILSYYFGGFSIISVIANVAVAPLFYLLLLDLFVSSISSVFWFALGSFFIIPADTLINVILKMSDFFISLPYSFINTDIFKNKVVFLMYYAGLIILFIFLNYFVGRKEMKNNIKNNV